MIDVEIHKKCKVDKKYKKGTRILQKERNRRTYPEFRIITDSKILKEYNQTKNYLEASSRGTIILQKILEDIRNDK